MYATMNARNSDGLAWCAWPTWATPRRGDATTRRHGIAAGRGKLGDWAMGDLGDWAMGDLGDWAMGDLGDSDMLQSSALSHFPLRIRA